MILLFCQLSPFPPYIPLFSRIILCHCFPSLMPLFPKTPVIHLTCLLTDPAGWAPPLLLPGRGSVPCRLPPSPFLLFKPERLFFEFLRAHPIVFGPARSYRSSDAVHIGCGEISGRELCGTRNDNSAAGKKISDKSTDVFPLITTAPP